MDAFYNKLLAQRQPTTNALYFFFDANELVYVSRKMKCDHPHDSFTVVSLKGDLVELEQKFIEHYKPRYNVQRDESFRPFDYYRQYVGGGLSSPQTNLMVGWMQKLPSALIKEAIDRVVVNAPDKPFGYMKWLLDDWVAKGYTTVEQVQKTHKTQGGTKDATIRRSLESGGHYYGIAPMDF